MNFALNPHAVCNYCVFASYFCPRFRGCRHRKQKNVQLSIQTCAGINSFATNASGSPVAKATFHTFLRTNALDSVPFKAMVTLQIAPENKNKCQPVVLLNGGDKKHNSLIKSNNELQKLYASSKN